MRNALRPVAAAAAVLLAACGAHAQAPVPIKVSYQPSLYWALPFHVATQKGWWAEAGLKPEFSTFPAGVPQIAAAVSKSWDVGATGSVPAVLGHIRFGIRTIGISNDESAANALLVRKEVADAARQNPKSLAGKQIVLTTNSTGDYAVQSCLRKWGLAKSDVTIKNMGQAEIISAMSSGNVDYGGLWAPNIYTLEEKAGAQVLCSGKDGGVAVPGALIARGEFAEQNPDAVARFLAVYLRAWGWMEANRPAAIEAMRAFYAQGGVNVSDASMAKEFQTRPTFALERQLALMDRAKGASEVDGWFDAIAEFMRAGGSVPAVPKAADYITDAYLKRVRADPALRAFANRKD